MVHIIVFVPSPDHLPWMEAMARQVQSSHVSIDAVHRFGTPEVLN